MAAVFVREMPASGNKPAMRPSSLSPQPGCPYIGFAVRKIGYGDKRASE